MQCPIVTYEIGEIETTARKHGFSCEVFRDNPGLNKLRKAVLLTKTVKGF